jgi:predicted Zn-ribbon and HTH transcriptional regulator
MSTDAIIFAYVVVLLAALSVVAIYFEHRRRRFEPTPSEDHIFRCEKCGFVYTDDRDVERSRCPQCGTSNNVFTF